MDLTQLTDIILYNLEEIEDNSFIKDNVKNFEYTDISYLQPTFEDISEFFKENNRWPDYNYVKGIAGELIREDDTLFSKDILLKWNKMIMTAAKNAKAKIFIDKDQPERAIEILQTQLNGQDLPKPTYTLDALERYRKIEAAPTQGLYWGVPELDAIYKYCTPGTLNLIVAPPKMGKTTTAFNSLYKNLMCQEVNLGYFCMELTITEMVFNIISIHSKKMKKPLSAFRLKSQEIKTEREQMVIDEVEKDFEANKKGKYVLFRDSNLADMQPSTLARFILEIKNDMGGKFDGLYTDYLQLMRNYRPQGLVGDEKSILNFWVRWFHAMCTAHDYTQFLLSQANREGTIYIAKNRMVNNSILAEANELERTSARSVVMFADEVMRASNQADYYCLHHRNGMCPSEPFTVYADYAHFDIGEDSFQAVKTLESIEAMLDSNGGLFA